MKSRRAAQKRRPAAPVDLGTVREAARVLRAMAATYPELSGPRGWRAALPLAVAKQAEESVMGTTKVLSVRVEGELVARLDRHVERLNAATPGLGLSRAQIVAALLTRALDEVDGKGKPKRRG